MELVNEDEDEDEFNTSAKVFLFHVLLVCVFAFSLIEIFSAEQIFLIAKILLSISLSVRLVEL